MLLFQSWYMDTGHQLQMCKRWYSVDVEVIDGVLYTVGDYNGLETQKSVKVYRPSIGVSTNIA